MDGEARTHEGPRTHAVAGAPVEPLLARSHELARRWAIALILARPLAKIGEVPLEDLAQDGPALVEQLIRALASERELEGLTGSPAAGPRRGSGALALPLRVLVAIAGAGVGAGPAMVEAVEALRGVLYDALRAELAWPGLQSGPPLLLLDTSDRLAFLCSTLVASALGGQRSQLDAALGGPVAGEGALAEAGLGGAGLGESGGQDVRVTRVRAVLIDERDGEAAAAGAGTRPHVAAQREARAAAPPPVVAGAPGDERMTQAEPSAPPPQAGARARRRAQPRSRPWDTPLDPQARERSAPGAVVETIESEGGAPVMRISRRTRPPGES